MFEKFPLAGGFSRALMVRYVDIMHNCLLVKAAHDVANAIRHGIGYTSWASDVAVSFCLVLDA